MKKALSLMLCLAMALLPPGGASAAGDAPFAAGDGTVTAPYLVSTPEQLMAVDDYPGSCFLQTNDIDLSGLTSWSPVENSGDYDGGGNRVYGLDGSPLFSANTGSIRRLGLADSTVSGSRSGYSSQQAVSMTIGGLVSVNEGEIEQCYLDNVTVSGSASLSSDYWQATASATVGGIAGQNSGTITDCYIRGGSVSAGASSSAQANIDASASATAVAGGLVGENTAEGVIDTGYSTAEVTASADAYSNTGYIETERPYSGTVCGENLGTISNCYYSSGRPVATGGSNAGVTQASGRELSNYTYIIENLNRGDPYGHPWEQDFSSHGTAVLDMQNISLSPSHPSGTYDMPISLSLEGYHAASTDVWVSYSIDGAAGGPRLYDGPIQLDGAATVRVWVESKYSNSAARVFTLTYRAAEHPVAASPAPGVYSEPQAVFLSSETPGAQIYYTTDGSDPTGSDTAYRYTGAPIFIDYDTTITAAAQVDGVFGDPLSFDYRISPAVTAAPAAGSYDAPISVSLETQDGYQIYYTTNGYQDPREDGTLYSGPIEIFKTTTLKVSSTANGGESWSDVVEFQYGLPEITITPSRPSGACTEPFQLSLAYSPDVDYLDLSYQISGSYQSQPYTGPIEIYKTTGITVYARYNGNTVADTKLEYTFPEPVITAQPEAGSYGSIQNVSLSCEPSFYELYYTLDGSDPAENGIPYTAPFELDRTTDVTVCAKYGQDVVARESFSYSMNLVTVSANHPSGDYEAPLTIELTPSQSGYGIYYTTDGSDPKVNGILYEGPFQITEPVPTTVRAVAVRTAGSYVYYGTAARFSYTFSAQSLKFEDVQVEKREGYDVSLSVTNTLPEEKPLSFYLAAYSGGGRLLGVCVHSETFPVSSAAPEVSFSLLPASPLPEGSVLKLFCFDSDTQSPCCEPTEWPLEDIPVIHELASISSSVDSIVAYEGEKVPLPKITAHYTNGKPDAAGVPAVIQLGDTSVVDYIDSLWCKNAGQTTLNRSYTEGDITRSLTIPITVKPTSTNLGFLANPTAEALPEDAIPISTAEELAAIGGAQSAGKTYYLTQDIHLASEWIPVNGFQGVFDGRGHKISGLYILAGSECPQAGLFGYTSNAVIRNVAVEIDPRGVNAAYYDEYSPTYGGGLAASAAYTHIENCYTAGGPVTVSGNGSIAGGLVGYIPYQSTSQRTVNCFSVCDVTANTHKAVSSNTTMAGGLVGHFNSASSISRCYAAGRVSSVCHVQSQSTQIGICAGGLVGRASGGSISDCFAYCSVSARHLQDSRAPLTAGGLVGYCSGVLSSCYAASTPVSAHATANSVLNKCSAYLGALSGYGGRVDQQCYRATRMGGEPAGETGNINVTRNEAGYYLSQHFADKQEYYTSFDFDSTWQFTHGAFQELPHLQYDPN